jgi:lipoate-protein ligase B
MHFDVIDLGLADYQKTYELQKAVLLAVKEKVSRSSLILCRHLPVITKGRAAKEENILISNEELENKRIQVVEVERGGDVTYHGPGQLTVYPVFNLNFFKKDIQVFLRRIESAVINFLGDFGVSGQRVSGLTGVWVNEEKISSIGIAIKNWITYHGVSINIKKEDLSNFQFIRPCGMDIRVTSLESCLGKSIEIDSVKEKLINTFRYVFAH